jgi:hypothetical protein
LARRAKFVQNCRYCNLPVSDPVETLAYWNQTPDVCHAECKVAGERQEAIDCQIIDADCNDCKHFKRGYDVKRWLSCMVDEKPSFVLENMGINVGHCLKFNKITQAFPHMSTGRECFEHRRN